MFSKKLLIILTAATLATGLAACKSAALNVPGDKETVEQKEEVADTAEKQTEEGMEGEIKYLTRKSLLEEPNDESDLRDLKPDVPETVVSDDMSNITNFSDFEYYQQGMLDKIKENGFVVVDGGGREFFEQYESNRYCQIPNFVTVDSMMHTYHVYFAYMMRDIEKNHLYDELKNLTGDMVDRSRSQYDELKGSKWEDSAKTNLAFFSVAAKLLDESAQSDPEVSDMVDAEYDLVMAAEGPDDSPLFPENAEDYSQYKPRGYYDGDATLEKYFRAMMWYGRRQFDQDDENADRSALLITLALDDGCYDKWSTIYSVTSFFAGASDDLGYCEYMPVIQNVYGDDVKISDISNDDASWDKFHKLTATLRAPRINSIIIEDTEDASNVIPGYRFMGQRFTIDATIMQELIYRRVGEFDDADKRMLPDVLDVPAALGSDMAYSILKEDGQTKYKNYDKNLENMKKEFAGDDNSIWNASLYASWLNTLRPLLEVKGKGYPTFMQNDEWIKKDLESFAGSFTELKHDTVLYSKQVMAEMGGGWDEEKDFRGYVEPEPLVYSRFEYLAKKTAEGLKEYGYLSKADEEDLTKLADLAESLKTISVKELQNEDLTDEEYELIEIYGGEIEHFWLDAMKAQTGEEYPNSNDYPAALVVDVATDPNGSVLEMATGDPATVYVVVPVEGKPRIAVGTVFSFYQFVQPISDRMTDKEWRRKLGIDVDIDENYNITSYAEDVEHPDWVNGYRYVYTYEEY